MIKKLSFAVAAMALVAGSFVAAPARADHHYHSDFERLHCRDYGGVYTPGGGCYISSKFQRKRLIADEQAWEAARMHRHHDEFEHPYYDRD